MEERFGHLSAGDVEGIDAAVATQAEVAVEMADAVLLVVDAQVGITETDAQVVRMLRRSGKPVVLAANKVDSAAQEGDKIKEALRLGAYGYILKPFKYERLRATLCSLRNHQRNIRQQEVLNTQELIDKSFDTVSNSVNTGNSFPKGIQEGTLQLVECAIKDENAPISAGDLAKKLEISRVTVQRYINFLKESGRIMEEIDYRQKGRPVKRFTYIS